MNHEISKGADRAGLAASISPRRDHASWSVLWTCEKWSEDACTYARRKLGLGKHAPVRSTMLRKYVPKHDLGVELVEGNLLTTVGLARFLDLLIGAGGTAYNNANSRMGVGDTATAANIADTKLGATEGNAANTQWVVMNATFPSRATSTVTWQSDFTSGLANFHWQEWGIDNGTTNTTTHVAPLLNHKVEDLGTKTTGTWTLSGAITVA